LECADWRLKDGITTLKQVYKNIMLMTTGAPH
jgi:hypothetical protein